MKIDTGLHPLIDGEPPDWASGWGHDQYGVFVEFSLSGKTDSEATQRLRWIPPGRFLMGSPNGEEGRFDWEGPRHEVMIAHGYYLFDTACTQVLWEAVMGTNPSRFKSSTRPVENVSFFEVQHFLKEINTRLPGLDLMLPSEAQWEYACRAGTSTSTFAGEMKTFGEHNAPILDSIAWYSGNGGVRFEIDSGEESTASHDKPHTLESTGTHPVGLKAPNPWGLYDMLGNVSEGCADHWHRSYEGAPTDGSSWIDSRVVTASHVIRGGSWNDPARSLRAAHRFIGVPADRSGSLGFRCARVQVANAN